MLLKLRSMFFTHMLSRGVATDGRFFFALLTHRNLGDEFQFDVSGGVAAAPILRLVAEPMPITGFVESDPKKSERLTSPLSRLLFMISRVFYPQQPYSTFSFDIS